MTRLRLNEDRTDQHNPSFKVELDVHGPSDVDWIEWVHRPLPCEVTDWQFEVALSHLSTTSGCDEDAIEGITDLMQNVSFNCLMHGGSSRSSSIP